MIVVMLRRDDARRGATARGGPLETARAAGRITRGMEEEFVLLDPSTGTTVLAAPDLIRMLGGEPGVQPELRDSRWRSRPECASAWTASTASWPGSGGSSQTPRRSWGAAWWRQERPPFPTATTSAKKAAAKRVSRSSGGPCSV
jgi:hypothetical protein